MTTTPKPALPEPTYSMDECDAAFVRDFCPYKGSPDPFVVWRAAWTSASTRADQCTAAAQARIAELEGALRDLVYCKDMKERLRNLHEMGHGTDYTDYRRLQPLAWASARAALASTSVAEPPPEVGAFVTGFAEVFGTGRPRAATPVVQPEAVACRKDGRCQYAIDHGAEGLGHCPDGKCWSLLAMPAARCSYPNCTGDQPEDGGCCNSPLASPPAAELKTLSGICQPEGLKFDAFGEPRTRYVRVSLSGNHCVMHPSEGDCYVEDARNAGDPDWERYIVRDVWLSEREFEDLPEHNGF